MYNTPCINDGYKGKCKDCEQYHNCSLLHTTEQQTDDIECRLFVGCVLCVLWGVIMLIM